MYTQTVQIIGKQENLEMAIRNGCPDSSDIFLSNDDEVKYVFEDDASLGVSTLISEDCCEITYLFNDDIDIGNFIYFAEIEDLDCKVTSISKRALMYEESAMYTQRALM